MHLSLNRMIIYHDQVWYGMRQETNYQIMIPKLCLLLIRCRFKFISQTNQSRYQ